MREIKTFQRRLSLNRQLKVLKLLTEGPQTCKQLVQRFNQERFEDYGIWSHYIISEVVSILRGKGLVTTKKTGKLFVHKIKPEGIKYLEENRQYELSDAEAAKLNAVRWG